MTKEEYRNIVKFVQLLKKETESDSLRRVIIKINSKLDIIH